MLWNTTSSKELGPKSLKGKTKHPYEIEEECNSSNPDQSVQGSCLDHSPKTSTTGGLSSPLGKGSGCVIDKNVATKMRVSKHTHADKRLIGQNVMCILSDNMMPTAKKKPLWIVPLTNLSHLLSHLVWFYSQPKAVYSQNIRMIKHSNPIQKAYVS